MFVVQDESAYKVCACSDIGTFDRTRKGSKHDVTLSYITRAARKSTHVVVLVSRPNVGASDPDVPVLERGTRPMT